MAAQGRHDDATAARGKLSPPFLFKFHKAHALLTHRQHSRRKGETPNALAQRRECRQDVQDFAWQESRGRKGQIR